METNTNSSTPKYISYDVFCNRIAMALGLELAPGKRPNGNRYTFFFDYAGIARPMYATFDGGSDPDSRPDYLAQVYTKTGAYLGAISYNYGDVQHFEVGVSPTHLYDEHDNPIDHEGNPTDGQGWIFWQGKSVTAAVKSLLRGGSRDGRKPLKIF